jgi:hypothetical protein
MGILVAGMVSLVVITAALWLAAVDFRRQSAHVMEYMGP